MAQEQKYHALIWNDKKWKDEEIKTKLSELTDKDKYKFIDLSHNILRHLPDLSQFTSLEKIIASYNQIIHIEPFYLPIKVVKLDLTGNRLRSVPSLKHCDQLQHVYLGKNHITKLADLPPTMEFINLEENPIKSFTKYSFPTEDVYNEFNRSLSTDQVKCLEEPPPEIFQQGFCSIQQYFDEFVDNEKANLLKASKEKIIVIGESGSGKSSFCQSLLKGHGVLTDEDDHTIVVDIWNWKANDECRFQLFDQGGHHIYQITNKLFISDGCNIVLCHDITQKDDPSINETLAVLVDTIRRHPANKLYIVLTHTDLETNPDELEKIFCQKMQHYLHQEIVALEDMISRSKNAEEKASLTLAKCQLEQKFTNTKTFLVSNITNNGIEKLAKELLLDLNLKHVKIPRTWIHCYQLFFGDSNKMFWEYDELLREYKKVFSICDFLVEFRNHEHSLRTYLKYLHDRGHVLWFSEHPQLKKIVFHKLEYVVNMFKALLHHDLEGSVDYFDNTSISLRYTYDQYIQAVRNFRKNGILSQLLMVSLWEIIGLDTNHFESFLALIKTTDMLHELEPEGTFRAHDRLFYVPWLVHMNNEPEDMSTLCSPNRNNIMHKVICEFPRGMPSSFFECMCVRLQRYIMGKCSPFSKRAAWKNGLRISLDNNTFILTRSDDTKQLKLIISSSLSDVSLMWKHFGNIKDELESLLKEFPACPFHLYMFCPHCLFHNYDKPEILHLQDAFNFVVKTANSSFNCPKEDGVPLPSAMVHPINPVHPEIEKSIKDELETYYKLEWSEIPVNERLSPQQKQWMKDHESVFTQLLHVSDVIHHISIHLSIQEREEIMEHGPAKQARGLFEILLKGTQSMMQCLKQSLVDSTCHPNRVLANYIMTHHSIVPNITDNITSSLLTKEETDAILHMKEVFMENVHLRDLIPKLKSSLVIDFNHSMELDSKQSEHAKASYLVEVILLRGTYQIVEQFKTCLEKCNQHELAKCLPKRE